VGAAPVSMVDYIAVSEANEKLLAEVAKGLYVGCEMAGVSLSGGELAQVAELLNKKPGKTSFDIVGTAIGTVDPDHIIIGQNLKQGDMLVGMESSGVHSNGYTLARKICFDANRLSATDYIQDLGRTIGEELLMPTRIYVKEVLEMLKQVQIKGLFHITGDGFFNLTRTSAGVGYRIESLPEPPAIFHYLQKMGNISYAEMFRVFNMGIGFALVIPDDSTQWEKLQSIANAAGRRIHRLGYVVDDPSRTITIEPYQIAGHSGSFHTL
jgi:phosphoribosylformylglycinamidine cyclo-ligase